MRIKITALAAIIIASASFAACYDKSTSPTEPSPDGLSVTDARAAAARIKSVTVSPGSASVQVGSTVQLSATSKPPGASFVWASSNQSVATVNQSGLVTGVSAGQATVSASAG
jgi:glucosylceramidase